MQPFVPSEAWIEAFRAQSTDALRKKAKRFAAMRAHGVGRAGGRVDDLYARELVQDALTDTLFGVLTWDPDATPLETHVIDAIRSRTRHDRKHARKFRHHAIDAFDPQMDTSATMGDVEGSLRLERATPSPEALAFAGEVVAQVRALAGDDKLVVRLLDAITLGATTKADIMHVARMSAKTYRNARDRLRRLIRQLNSSVDPALRNHA